jgi:hypothetical protein
MDPNTLGGRNVGVAAVAGRLKTPQSLLILSLHGTGNNNRHHCKTSTDSQSQFMEEKRYNCVGRFQKAKEETDLLRRTKNRLKH